MCAQKTGCLMTQLRSLSHFDHGPSSPVQSVFNPGNHIRTVSSGSGFSTEKSIQSECAGFG